MNVNLMDMYGNVGAVAKANAEQAAARSARVAGVMQEGYRLLLDDLNATIGNTARVLGNMGQCRTPADVAELQREWFEAASSLAAERMKAMMALSNKLVAEVSAAPAAEAAATEKAAPAAAPAAALVVEAPVEAPVEATAAPAVTETVVEAPAEVAPVAEAPAVEAPAVEAPVAEAAPETAPAVTETVEEKAAEKPVAKSGRRAGKAASNDTPAAAE